MAFDVTKYTKSRWIKAAEDVPAEGLTLTVRQAREHTFQDGMTKPFLSFLESPQDLVLNKTRCIRMVELFGADPTRWKNQRVRLTTQPTHVGPTIIIDPVGVPSQPSSVVYENG